MVQPSTLRAAVDSFVAAAEALFTLDRSQWSGSDAVEVMAATNAVRDRYDAFNVDLAGIIDASGVWGLDGSRSAAAWLARQTRTSRAAAGSDLKLARALRDLLPRSAEALVAGSLPVGHARVIARTCTRTEQMRELLGCPKRGEALLLGQAQLSAEDFARFCAAWAYRADPDAADRAYREASEGFELRLADTTAGVVPSGLLSPTVAEMLRTALRAEIGVPAKTDPRTTAQRLHDALGSLTARVLDGGALGRTHAVRPQIVVQVPLATLRAKRGTPGVPPAWLQDSQCPIPTWELDRIGCDAEVMRAVMSTAGEVLEFGRAKRLFEGPLRRAMETRDGGCRYPGCFAPSSQTEGHHRTRWVDGGLTNLDDGCLLCWFHHVHVHAKDITITPVSRGGLEFRSAGGELIGISYPKRGPDPDPLPWKDDPYADGDAPVPGPETRSTEVLPSNDACRGPT